MRRADRIEDFRRSGHNPAYLSDVIFDTSRIDFSDDINEVCSLADTLVVALPSPYIKSHLAKICVDISQKNVVVATKGIIPDENILATDYFVNHYGCKHENMLVIGGPCHAEEVALQRLSYLTIGCRDISKSEAFAACLRSDAMKTICSADVDGIEDGQFAVEHLRLILGIISDFNIMSQFQMPCVLYLVHDTLHQGRLTFTILTHESYLIAFCVMGGIYSEGVDLAGDSLIGAVIVSIGMPALSYEREAIAAYYEEKYEEGKQYAYIYPGMNRVFQAAGRVIRREDDRGVIVLIDDRFDDPLYRKSLPKQT